MTFRRTTDFVREPALPMRPLVDPAGWTAADLAANDDWVYGLSQTELDELAAAVADVEARGLDIKDIGRDDFPLPTLGPALRGLRDQLLDGRGFLLIRGVPVAQMTKAQAAATFWGIGVWLGKPVSQNALGHLLGHVKDIGGDYGDPRTRGYMTRAHMGFHADQCDYVGLMCYHPAMKGGESRIVSAVTLYNEMLARRPDLVEELTRDFCWTRHGEIPPGKQPWYPHSVFSFEQGYFAARGISSHILKSQGMDGVPPFTERQLEAFDLFRALADELAYDMTFRQGDMQFLHNHVILHSRRGFEDWPEPERKRHLFRLWLCDEQGRLIRPSFRAHIRGIRVAGARFTAPLDVEGAAA